MRSSGRIAAAIVAIVVVGTVDAGCSKNTPVSSPGISVRPAGSLSLITEPSATFSWASAAISAARSSVDLVMYELSDTGIEQDLAAAVARGVKVTVLLDQDYEQGFNQAAYTYLASNRVRVAWANASTIFHQKTLCTDGTTCWVMTANFTSQYYSSSRDFIVVDTQPADVSAITATFATDLLGGSPKAGKSGADLLWSPGSQSALVSLITSAKSALKVENEEMSDPAVISALEGAARRGVNVEVTMTGESSWDSAFTQLVAAGAHVSTYSSNASLYIHAKVIVVDSSRAFVGSENFSTSSLLQNRELGIITTNTAVVSQLSSTLTNDYSGGTPWS